MVDGEGEGEDAVVLEGSFVSYELMYFLYNRRVIFRIFYIPICIQTKI